MLAKAVLNSIPHKANRLNAKEIGFFTVGTHGTYRFRQNKSLHSSGDVRMVQAGPFEI